MRKRSARASRSRCRGVAGVALVDRSAPQRPATSRTRRISRRSSAAAISPSLADCAAATPCPAGPAVRRRPADRDAVRQHRRAEHHARSRDRHRRLDRRRSSTRAVRKGIGRDGERLYPAMPYTALHEDVARGRAGDPRLSQHGRRRCATRSSPTSCRSRSTSAPACGCGTRCTSRRASSSPIPSKSAEWNRGAFLVDGPAIAAPATRRRRCSAATRQRSICRACDLQGWFAPDITNDTRRGLGGWSRRRHRRLSEDRPQPHHRRDRADGRGGRRCRARR